MLMSVPSVGLGGGSLFAATQIQATAWMAKTAPRTHADKLGAPRIMDLHAWGRLTLVEGPRTALAIVPWVSIDSSLFSAPYVDPTLEPNADLLSGHFVVGSSTSIAGRAIWGLRSPGVTSAALPTWTLGVDGGVRTALGLDAAGPPGLNGVLAVDGKVAGSWAIAPQGAAVGELAVRFSQLDGYVEAGSARPR